MVVEKSPPGIETRFSSMLLCGGWAWSEVQVTNQKGNVNLCQPWQPRYPVGYQSLSKILYDQRAPTLAMLLPRSWSLLPSQLFQTLYTVGQNAVPQNCQGENALSDYEPMLFLGKAIPPNQTL